jgi:hypothetical protein
MQKRMNLYFRKQTREKFVTVKFFRNEVATSQLVMDARHFLAMKSFQFVDGTQTIKNVIEMRD